MNAEYKSEPVGRWIVAQGNNGNNKSNYVGGTGLLAGFRADFICFYLGLVNGRIGAK